MKEYEYLSEEELERLILSAEEEQLQAPEDLLDEIMAALDDDISAGGDDRSESMMREIVREIQRPPKIMELKSRRTEFRKYCLRVIASAAAAIALILMLPDLGNSEHYIPDKETVMAAQLQPKAESTAETEAGFMFSMAQSHVIADLFGYHIFK